MDTEATPALAQEVHSVIQLGIVVADLDASIQGMRNVFGLAPTAVKDCRYPEVRYHGQVVDAWARIARFEQFGVVIEYIQPFGEDSMWTDALKASPTGQVLHHIRFNDVPDNDAVTALMAERGVELLQEGRSIVNPNGKFTFYDTQDQLGFISEVVTAAQA